jgi:hypothetical protein
MTITFGSHLGRQEGLSVEEAVGSKLPLYSPQQLREKRWCYIGVVSDECIVGTALVHLGYAANAFSFVYDRLENKMVEKGYVVSPLTGMAFSRDPDNGQCILSHKKDSIVFEHDIANGKRSLKLDVARDKNKQILGEIVIEESKDSQALQLLTPMQERKKNAKRAFTQKIAGLKTKGFIETQSKRYEFNEQNAFAIFDWTNGFHNRITQWNWACAGGFSECGKRLGFNFSKDVYTFGFSENVIWIDGEPTLFDDVEFEYDSKNPMEPWHVFNKEKTIDINFYPEGKRQANENFVFAASNFIQACGSFSGYLCDKNGKKIKLKQLGGVVEEHYAKW